MYKINKRGSRAEPWDTPMSRLGQIAEDLFSNWMNKDLSQRLLLKMSLLRNVLKIM